MIDSCKVCHWKNVSLRWQNIEWFLSFISHLSDISEKTPVLLHFHNYTCVIWYIFTDAYFRSDCISIQLLVIAH